MCQELFCGQCIRTLPRYVVVGYQSGLDHGFLSPPVPIKRYDVSYAVTSTETMLVEYRNLISRSHCFHSYSSMPLFN
jgi:hypothetical protein